MRTLILLAAALVATPALACVTLPAAPVPSFHEPVRIIGPYIAFGPITMLNITLLHDFHAYHSGNGDPVIASQSGRVTVLPASGDHAASLTIDHGGGWVTSYDFDQKPKLMVATGDCVVQDQVIATLGKTEPFVTSDGQTLTDVNGLGPTLYHRLTFNGVPLDPLSPDPTNPSNLPTSFTPDMKREFRARLENMRK